ncbi:MAG: LCP family protein [Bacilli bacterium]
MKKKKRRLRLPFRIIRALFIIIIFFVLILFAVYKYFIEDDLKSTIKTYNETIYDKDLADDHKVLSSSYLVAILGVDETLYNSRVDSINVMAINAKSNEMRIYSVPRDTYIQYKCIGEYSDKITNSHSYGGIECTLDGLNNLFNHEIDFYLKLDFSGFISIIDQVGTITTNIPDFYDGQEWCEQTSNRVDQICFSQFGKQEVNSEQALAIARSRQHSSDLNRNTLQSQIISDTIKEIMKIRDINDIEKIIDSVDGKIKSNISPKQAAYMLYNMYLFNKTDNKINTYQLKGIAQYQYGNYAGYGSYFILDPEELQKTRETINKFMEKEE